MPLKLTTSYAEDALAILRQYKKMAEAAMEQVSDEHLQTALDPEMNSIAIIVKHIAGNMRSRRTGFLTSDGEKPGRNRDSEFFDPAPTREALMKTWQEGWDLCFRAIEALSEADLARTVTIRNEPHSVMQAINRQLAHYTCHIGQIVFLAKHFQSDKWKSLTVPRNRAAESAAKKNGG